MQTQSLGATIPLRPTLLPHGNGRTTARHPVLQPRAAKLPRRLALGLNWLATVTLVAVVLAMVFFVFRNGQPAVIPPTQETPTAVATPAPSSPGVWPVANGGNAARTRNMPGPAPVGQPVVLWTFPAPESSGIGAINDFATVADGNVYLLGGEGLVALDARTGEERWRTAEVGGAQAIDADGLILRSAMLTGDGYDLVRISRVDGTVVWRAEQGRIDENWTPVVADGVGYIPSGSDLLAFDPATGNEHWRAPLDAPALRGAAVANGLAVVADVRNTIYGIETSGGDIVWTHRSGAPDLGTPTLANGLVYVAAVRTFDALDAITGDPRWSFASPSGQPFRSPAVDATSVYVTDDGGALYALDAATGSFRWSFRTGGGGANNPVLVGDTVFVSNNDGTLVAVDAATGTERWRFPMNGYSAFVPIVVDGIVYAGTRDGRFFAIGGSGSAADSKTTPQPAASPATSSTANPATTVAGTPATATGVSVEFVWQASIDHQQPCDCFGGIAIAPDGNIWLADSGRDRFQIFAPDGTPVETWGDAGSGNGQFNFLRFDGLRTGAVAFAPDGSFYVADPGNTRIQQFASDRRFVRAWGSQGTGDGQFLSPLSIAVDAQGNVFVGDDYRNDIQKFDATGRFLLKVGGTGNADGQLSVPVGIGLDTDGNLWVADMDNRRLKVWGNDGRFLASWDGDGRLRGVNDVAVDAERRVYAADHALRGVIVLDSFGNVLGRWGGDGSRDGQFTTPFAIALDGQGNVYVTDAVGSSTRLQKFRLLPPFGPERQDGPKTATPAA